MSSVASRKIFKTLKACRSCLSWRDCNGHWYKVDKKDVEYYKLSEIKYCRFQVRWIISEFLRAWADEIIVMRDTWPSEDTDYTDAPPTQHSLAPSAPFERVLQVVAEVRNRLAKTGPDGRELVLMLENKAELSSGAKDALSYCSGWKRKRDDYRRWLTQRERRKIFLMK